METTINSKTIILDTPTFTPNRMNGMMLMQSLHIVVLRMQLSVYPVAKSLLHVMTPYCKIQFHTNIMPGQLMCCSCQCSL